MGIEGNQENVLEEMSFAMLTRFLTGKNSKLFVEL